MPPTTHRKTALLSRITFLGTVFAILLNVAVATFPRERPDKASYQHPQDSEVLDISPPGFNWWRAGDRGQIKYRLFIHTAAGKKVYTSPFLSDPVHVPDIVLAAGDYTWTVDALDPNGRIFDTLEAGSFSISKGAIEQPWLAPEKLLAKVPDQHPRLLFPVMQLETVKATLNTTRREAFESLKRNADQALKLSVPDEPDYDELTDPAVRRLAYKDTFAELRRYHQGGMDPLALMYLLTGEKKYGLKARDLLLGAAEWDPEGISSILAPYGDEVGLSLVRSGPHTYDWIYDLLSPVEQEKVRRMLIARADQMLRRLQKQDYLMNPSGSHNGRLPGYLIEHALVLAEEPRAEVWMDYAMRTVMTCFPHWAGKDGGWAEGISYGLAYNTIYLVPFESLRHATGFNLWQRPFYRKVRNFFMYAISPVGDIKPFGDTEHAPATGSTGGIRSLLSFHANLFQDETVRWWIDTLRSSDGSLAKVSGTAALILPDEVKPALPTALPNDAAFFGIGWALLHSNILEPTEDLMVSFKSSPYGAVSHSHADQNSFAIMKGGKSLAIPAGERYPAHGTPFHEEYVQQTLAHNAVLIDGQGQINRDGNRGGQLVDFQSTKHMGYALGDVTNCFDAPATLNQRHMLLIRPSLLLVVDDLAASEAVDFQWLLHAHKGFSIDESSQTILSRKGSEAMTVTLLTEGGFKLEQTDEWPMDPKEGYPKTTKTPPAKQWHLTAETRNKTATRRIAAVMAVWKDGVIPDYTIKHVDKNRVEMQARFNADQVMAVINLDRTQSGSILEARYVPAVGKEEVIKSQ